MKVLIANPAVRRPISAGMERYMMGAGVRFPWSMLKPVDERPRFSLFPMFLGYAAALAENDGFDVSVVDAVPLNLSDDEQTRRIVDVGPDIVVMQPNALMIEDVARLTRTRARRRTRHRRDRRLIRALRCCRPRGYGRV